MTPLPHHIQQQSTDRKLEQLKQHGIAVQPILLRSRKEFFFCFVILDYTILDV
jgi:uncharacterized protein (DUF2126 family)